MELQRFDAFVSQLHDEQSLRGFGSVTEVYRVTNGTWYDAYNAPVTDTTVSEILSTVDASNEHWRGVNDPCTYFPIPDLGCVVAFTCYTPPWKKTRDRVSELIDVALKHSSDAFDAEHDALTGLLNARSIEALLKKMGVPHSPPGEDEPKIVPSSALVALDLDHFKQVNDSFGHDYGDVVLRCFARRLTKALKDLQTEQKQLKLFAGRIGGEEFVVIVDGVVSSEGAKGIAERIRASLAENILPTDDEWTDLHGVRPTSLELPHSSDRKVTVSIGVSSIVTATNRSEPCMLDLRREADEALYRAKAGGRNTVRWFPEIRDKFGTVLEHHSDTDVVVVDIGSHLNVRQGDEFHVYHPDFTGEKPFVYSDGRTKKRLGFYPKLPSGRLIVFQVQPEIAFCKVADRSVPRFPAGSSLEYIPVGSIAHLIGGDSDLGATRGLPLSSPQKLEKLISESRAPTSLKVFVFRLDQLEQLERARGVVFINRALAALFEAVQEVIGPKVTIGQLQSDTLAVVVAQATLEPIAAANEVLAKARGRFGEAPTFGAGVYDGSKYEPLPGDESKIDPKSALHLARYAALPGARVETALVERFTPDTAFRLLRVQKDARKFREARADYAAFKKVGISYSEVENQLGLIEVVERNWEAAVLAFERAIQLDPEHYVLQANKAFAQFFLGRRVEAYQTVQAIPPEFDLPPVYVRIAAMAAFETFKQDPRAVAHDRVAEMLETSKTQGTDVTFYGLPSTEIDQAIASLASSAQPEPAA